MSIRSPLHFRLFLLFLWASGAVQAAPSQVFPPSLAGEIDLLLKRSHLTEAALAIDILAAKDGKPLYRYQPDLCLNPASAMKVLTSVTALEVLGAEHRYLTEFYSSTSVSDHRLPDLWIKGYGNPFLVGEEVGWIAGHLQQMGISKIDGPIYVDDSYFHPEPPLQFPGTTGRGVYRVITGALSFNFNPPPALKFRGKRWRKPASEADPLERPPLLGDRMIDPALYTGFALQEALQRRGIQASGPVLFREVSPEASPILFHASRRLAEIVTSLNKFSNNFIAEQLFKSVGAARFGGPASEEKGRRALAELLSRVSANPARAVLANGSGLSHRNRIAASHLTALLRHALAAPYAEAFVRSLAVGGVDGTLYRRFQKSPLRGKLWAKSGSLYRVSALVGYLMADGDGAIFAILANDFTESPHLIQQVEEKILEAVARYLDRQSRGASG